MRHLACALLATALATAPALAQSNQPASNADRTNTQANAGQFLTQERPNQWRASKLRGLDVYNNNNEKVGDIREVLLNRDGKAEAVVIGAGGFLGIGEHDVAVPFGEVKFVDQPRNTNTSDNRPAGANTNTANRSATDGRPSGADAAPTTAGPVPTTGAPATGRTTGANTNTTSTASGTAASNDNANRTAANTTGSTAGSASRSDTSRSYPDHAVVNLSRDQLRNAPAFQYAR
jgi:sporulation protein YlmC with PRC-barrel domain